MDDLTWQQRRWRAADEEGRNDDADAACRALFAAVVPEPDMSPAFTARTMEAIAATAARDKRRAHSVRTTMIAGGVLGAGATVYFGTGFALSTLSAAVVGVLDFLIGTALSIASGMRTGADVWSFAAGLGRAFSAFISDPKVTFAMLALQGIAIAALMALQRLLGTDEGSLK